MSGGMTLIFVIALGVIGLSILYVVYYVTSIANSVNDVRAQARREMTAKEEQLRDTIRSALDQRTEWTRTENAEALATAKAEIAEDQAQFRRDMTQTLESIAREVAALRVRVEGLAATPSSPAASGTPHDSKGRPQGSA